MIKGELLNFDPPCENIKTLQFAKFIKYKTAVVVFISFFNIN